jgi:hypothetical protein
MARVSRPRLARHRLVPRVSGRDRSAAEHAAERTAVGCRASDAAYYAQHAKGARLKVIPGAAHYTFLDLPTERARRVVASFAIDPPGVDREAVHARAAQLAAEFFMSCRHSTSPFAPIAKAFVLPARRFVVHSCANLPIAWPLNANIRNLSLAWYFSALERRDRFVSIWDRFF